MRIYNRNSRNYTHYALRVMRNHFSLMDWWTFAIALTMLLLIILMPMRAHAEPATACYGNSCQGYQFLFAPVAPVPTDHFSPTQLAAAMTAAGYDPRAWQVYTHCAVDVDGVDLRYCYTSLDAGNGPGTQRVIEWLPWQFAPNGVIARKGIR